MTVPHEKNDRRGRSEKSTRKSVAQAPKLFVCTASSGYGGQHYAEAHLLIRRGCYQYLRWREGDTVKEFYLGKVKECTTQASSPRLAGPAERCVVRKRLRAE